MGRKIESQNETRIERQREENINRTRDEDLRDKKTQGVMLKYSKALVNINY